ncbi:hypothetical protein [Streptomyces mexicanus]|uniref:hypothetical protein n=1 Tax=Streptomyces mexicanus TaxID=178566 RepID=UPI0031E7292E
MRTRTVAVATAGVGAVVLTAAALTYASTTEDAPAAPSAHHAAAPAPRAAQAAPAKPAAQPAAPPAAAAEAVTGNGDRGGENGGEKGDDRGHDEGGRGRGDRDEGKIYFNERVYSATSSGCVTAASGLGSTSFSVFNDSRKTIEVYRGFTCDNGAPVATVGPHGATNGVATSTFHDGLFDGTGHGLVFGDDGVVGSFRVLDHDEDW